MKMLPIIMSFWKNLFQLKHRAGFQKGFLLNGKRQYQLCELLRRLLQKRRVLLLTLAIVLIFQPRVEAQAQKSASNRAPQGGRTTTQQQAQAQLQIRKSVFGNGDAIISNDRFVMTGTLGQPLIGVTQNSSNIKYLGFWYPPRQSSNAAPLVEGITATFQDQTIAPIGDDLARVLNALTTPVTIQATASHPNPNDRITSVRFELDGQSYEDSSATDGWNWPNLDLGLLSPTSNEHPNVLSAVAFDSHNSSSLPQFRNLNIIAQPCWITTHQDAFAFNDDRYKFDLRFPKPIYGLDYIIPKDIFLIGGKRIAVGLDFNMLWEHGIVTHEDLKEGLAGYFNVIVLGSELVRAERAGTLVVNDNFDIEQAKVRWRLDSGFRRVYYNGIKLDFASVAKVNVAVELLARLEVDINMIFDNCLALGPEATLVPVISGKGIASASVEVLFGVASASVGASPVLSLWLIMPLADAGNWGAGGQILLDWWARGKVFWVFKFSRSGRFGPYAFGKPRPALQAKLSPAAITQVEPNLPEILVRPAVAADSSGTLLLVWMKETAPVNGLMIPQIHAARWNAEQGFTEITPLTQGDTFDTDPAVAMDESGDAVVVWTRNKSSIADSSRPLEEILANSEITSMNYDAVSKSWSPATPITNDNFADGLPDVALSNHGEALCVWTHTKDNDLTTRSDWEIKYAARQNNSWSAPALLTNDNTADHSAKVAMNAEGLGVAVWTHDADADAATVDDIDIQYAIWNGSNWLSPVPLTNTIFEEHHPETAFDATGAPYAAWVEREIFPDSTKLERLMFSQGNLQQQSWSAPEIVFADSLLLEEPALQITTRAGEEIAMLSWRGYDGADGDMFLSLKNLSANSPWSQPVEVSQDTLVDWMTTAAFDSRNNAMILSIKTDLYNSATDNSKLGNFSDGINYFTAGIRSNLQLATSVNSIGGYLGDVTGDGKVTALDALVIETYRLGLLNQADYQKRIELGFGDVNFDNAANALDAGLILQHVVEETVPHPIGKWIWF